MFDPQNKKKWPQQLLITGPKLFLCTCSAAQAAKKQIPCHQKPLSAGLGIQTGFNSNKFADLQILQKTN